MNIDLDAVTTPCYVCDEEVFEQNGRVLASVRERTGSKILLALKGFAMFSIFPILRRYLDGVAASSLHEARLGRDEFDGEVHIYAPAYKENEFGQLLDHGDHITFNSFSQWRRFRPAAEHTKIQCGIRINPEHSEAAAPIYDPCAPGSRLGVTSAEFDNEQLDGITGLHFHTLCENDVDALDRTLDAVETKFAKHLSQVEWVNFGGGHHITREDYDVDKLCELIMHFKDRYGVQVYLEPGEAVALNAGVLVASVLDIVHNDVDIAILDASAAAHMPDVLEMPYRPEVEGAGEPGQYAYTYRLGGLTCLPGDIIGDYSFQKPLEIGTKLIFLDMAHYTMVKNTMFCGVPLPSIALYNPDKGNLRIVREFSHEDYKTRLS